MNRDKLEALERVTERFIQKRLKVNQPFQSLVGTDEFDAFQKSFDEAIAKQCKAVVKDLPKADDLATDKQVKDYVKSALPPLSDYITEDEVYDYYEFCFVQGVMAQYGRLGIKTSTQKAAFSFGDMDFELTNTKLINSLLKEADYLINKSSIDDTTREQLISIIMNGKIGENWTVDEIADTITDLIPEIAESRSMTIARTETSRAMGQGNYEGMVKNGVEKKRWVTAGDDPCEICQGNEDQGYIPIDEAFESGDDYEPAHPNDECYTEAEEIDLDSIEIWDGS